MRTFSLIFVLMVVAAGSVALGADPPEVIHYQGVLRDALDAPQTGAFGMTFRFFDDPAAGTEILCDSQTVTVTNGLFGTTLGEAAHITACMGSGDEVPLVAAFADVTDLYLQVEVGTEVLLPRIRVAASGYALNSRLVRGREIVAPGPLDIYVDAIGGDDANDGLTPTTAVQTIQSGVDRIPPIVHDDVTVHVAHGTYAEAVVLADRMQPHGATITLSGDTADPSQVVIDGSGVRSRGLSVSGVSDVIVEGFEVRNHISWAVAVIRGGTITLSNLSVVNNTLGMLLTRTYVTLSSVSLSNNAATSVLCQSGSTCQIGDLTVSGGNIALFSSRSSYVLFNGPAQISGVSDGLVADYGGTIELGQRADIQVTGTGSALVARLHGRALGYANATLSPTDCAADTYGICEP